MTVNHPLLIDRLVNRPLLTTPARAKAVLGVLAGESGITGELVDATGSPVSLSSLVPASAPAPGKPRPYQVSREIAVIEIEGSLVNKTHGLQPESGMTGYDGIAKNLDMALADPTVRGIVLDIESAGGEVAGVFDCADLIRAANDRKPVVAICSDHAFSAAYLLASQARGIAVPRHGEVGSIGAVWIHLDHSKALDRSGVVVTMVYSGEHKVDGNPFEPLPSHVRAEAEDSVSRVRDRFAEYVARGRASMSAADALATEARTYESVFAVEAGLADAVMAPREAFDGFARSLTSAAVSPAERLAPVTPAAPAASKGEDSEMNAFAPGAEAEQPDPIEVPVMTGQGQSDPSPEPAVVEPDENALAEARAEGRAAERDRIDRILNAEEAQGREATARHLATATDMEAEAAIGVLKNTPVASTSGVLDRLMASEPNPDIGTDDVDTAAAEDASAATAARIVGNYAAATGLPVNKGV